MKILDFQLDELFAAKDYDGMVAAVAQHLGCSIPSDPTTIDTSSIANWRWGRVIIYQHQLRHIYCRGGRTSKKPTFSILDCGIISELPF